LQLNHSGPYLSFISKEYPKFITENLSVTDLRKLKMQKQNLQECNRRIADFEKRRLHAETEAFAKQIHESRLNGKNIFIYFLILYIFSTLYNFN